MNENPYADGGCLADHLSMEAKILGRDLHAWARRDESKAQPEVRQAVNRAMESIDRALSELYRARQQLISEIHIYDEAATRRVDALLERCRREREARAAGAGNPDAGIVQAAPLDSEPWTCAGCGTTAIGRRPADDRCQDCKAGGAS